MKLYYPIVTAIASSIIDSHMLRDKSEPKITSIADFIIRQLSRMPDHLHAPMIMAIMFFDLWPLFRLRKPFHSMPISQQNLQLDRWRRSSVDVFRDFAGFFDNLTIFAWYSLNEAEKR